MVSKSSLLLGKILVRLGRVPRAAHILLTEFALLTEHAPTIRAQRIHPYGARHGLKPLRESGRKCAAHPGEHRHCHEQDKDKAYYSIAATNSHSTVLCENKSTPGSSYRVIVHFGRVIPHAAGKVDAAAISDTPGRSAGGCGRTGRGFLSYSCRCFGSPQIPFIQRPGKAHGGRSTPQR